MIDDIKAQWIEFEKMGVKQVTQDIAQGVLGEAGEKSASNWLVFKANEATQASMSEANATARRSSESANLSALACITQAQTAKAALAISIISISMSISTFVITLLRLLGYI